MYAVFEHGYSLPTKVWSVWCSLYLRLVARVGCVICLFWSEVSMLGTDRTSSVSGGNLKVVELMADDSDSTI